MTTPNSPDNDHPENWLAEIFSGYQVKDNYFSLLRELPHKFHTPLLYAKLIRGVPAAGKNMDSRTRLQAMQILFADGWLPPSVVREDVANTPIDQQIEHAFKALRSTLFTMEPTAYIWEAYLWTFGAQALAPHCLRDEDRQFLFKNLFGTNVAVELLQPKAPVMRRWVEMDMCY